MRAGVSRSTISRIESGRFGRVAIDGLERVLDALDARLELDVRWRGAALDRLVDERHATIIDASVWWVVGDGWEAVVEASFSLWGERGSIDVFARHPTGALLVIEVKASIGDVNQTIIGLDRKARLAPQIARERGWPLGPVARILVVGEGTTSRSRIHRHETAFRTALPATTSACRAWVRSPVGPPPAGIVFLASLNSHPMNTARGRAPRSAGPGQAPSTPDLSSRSPRAPIAHGVRNRG